MAWNKHIQWRITRCAARSKPGQNWGSQKRECLSETSWTLYTTRSDKHTSCRSDKALSKHNLGDKGFILLYCSSTRESGVEAQGRNREAGTEAELMEKGPYWLAQLVIYPPKHVHRSIQMKTISHLWFPHPMMSSCQVKLTMTVSQQNTMWEKMETLKTTPDQEQAKQPSMSHFE